MATTATATALIALAVVRKNGRFAAVLERDGWVDVGETFPTAAVRETLEEAGIRVSLDGILRLEMSPAMGRSPVRLRAVFLASPVDDSPLKALADKESVRAEWVAAAELCQRQLRSREVAGLFSWVDSGAAALHPCALLRGSDAPRVSPERVVAPCGLRVSLVVHREALVLAAASGEVPSAGLRPGQTFVDAARGLLEGLLPVAAEGPGGQPTQELRFAALEHVPYNLDTPAVPGRIEAVFCLHAPEGADIGPLPQGVRWLEAGEAKGPRSVLAEVAQSRTIALTAPCSIWVEEGMPYTNDPQPLAHHHHHLSRH
eukprot:m51a1_g1788 hypothetical protein (315) ;mRNA; f:385133-386181